MIVGGELCASPRCVADMLSSADAGFRGLRARLAVRPLERGRVVSISKYRGTTGSELRACYFVADPRVVAGRTSKWMTCVNRRAN